MTAKNFLKKALGSRNGVWNVLKSPRTIALIKLGASLVGVVHAIDEFVNVSPGKSKIGFRFDDNDKNDDD